MGIDDGAAANLPLAPTPARRGGITEQRARALRPPRYCFMLQNIAFYLDARLTAASKIHEASDYTRAAMRRVTSSILRRRRCMAAHADTKELRVAAIAVGGAGRM